MSGLNSISIITPVFNRAKLLNRIREHFKELDLRGKKVEWVVIDDGSTDEGVVNLLDFNNSNLSLKKLFQTNAGKHVALNNALSVVSYDCTLFLDSDDIITQELYDNIVNIMDNWSPNIKGYIGYNKSIGGEKIGKLEEGVFRPSKIFSVKGDYCRLVKTQHLKKFKFNQFYGETFLTEASFWIDVHENELFFSVDKVLVDYQDNGLSANYKAMCNKNPQGVAYTVKKALLSNSYSFTCILKFVTFHISTLNKPYSFIYALKNVHITKKLILLMTTYLYKALKEK